jgi:hypothetical protein
MQCAFDEFVVQSSVGRGLKMALHNKDGRETYGHTLAGMKETL